MLKVSVHSASRVVAEALAKLIAEIGYVVVNGSDAPPDVAVWSVHTRPFPKPPPSCPALAVVTFTEDDELAELLSLGYRGYHLPDSSPHHLKEAIHAVHAGEVWAARRIVVHAFNLPAPNLTPRQSEVIQLIRSGYSNKRIAAQLSMSEKTVKAHVSAVLEKFGVKNRMELVLKDLSPRTNGRK